MNKNLIPDPEGKHLQVCQLQLAKTVEQRDRLAKILKDYAEMFDGQGDESFAREIRRHVKEIFANKPYQELVDFGNLPLGARFKYPGSDRVWTVICQRREREGGATHGTIAQWEPDMLSYGKWPGQGIWAHIPESEGGDRPEKVIPVN